MLIDVVIQYFYLRIAAAIFENVARNSGYGVDTDYNLWAFLGLLLS